MKKFKPLYDNILVLPEEVQERTKSGIILSETTKPKIRKGTVVSIGNNVEKENLVKVNDEVLFFDFVGEKLELPQEDTDIEYRLLDTFDLLGVLKY